MKKILAFGLAVLLIFSLTNCATLFGKKLHPLSVSSDPVKAEVYVNGFKMGVTPIELNLKYNGKA